MKRHIVLATALIGVVATVPMLTAGASGRTTQATQSAKVTLKEFSITGSLLKPAAFGKASSLKAGKTTFTFKNAGKFGHNFTIIRTSKGAPKFHTATIAPGKTVTLTVNLKPGSYVAECTLFNGFHAAAGMVKGFSVGKFNGKKWSS